MAKVQFCKQWFWPLYTITDADYQSRTFPVTFDRNTLSSTVTIGILNDDIAERMESFRVVLISTSDAVTIEGNRSIAEVNILDTDSKDAMEFSFRYSWEGEESVVAPTVRVIKKLPLLFHWTNVQCSGVKSRYPISVCEFCTNGARPKFWEAHLCKSHMKLYT